MKRVLLLALGLFCSAEGLFAQASGKNLSLPTGQYDLTLPEGKVHFRFNTAKVIIKLKDGVNVQSFFSGNPYLKTYDRSWKVPFPDVYRPELNIPAGSNYDEVVAALNADSRVAYVAPVIMYKDMEQSLYDLVYVKLRHSSDISRLRQLATELSFTISEEYQKDIFFCRVDKHSAGNSFEIAARLQQLNLFEYAEPDFIYTCAPATTDPAYAQQWAINNTGQYNGTSGSDMKIAQAWGITTGSSSIKVAIFDCFGSAAEFTHPDISFFTTYDATGTGFNSSGFSGDAHGICCAGCIKATGNNNLGGAGIAYNANVIPVKVGTIINSSGNWNSTGNSISNGIIWAYQNADVMSNSNTLGSSSSLINTAISDGLTLGRGGKGTLFFSSAGNSNSTTISYPASNANTIAVAATSPCDQRKSPTSCDGESWWGSDYGTGVDIGAPGVKIHTTDLPGANGYSTGDYAAEFNGTSSACPNAAAVMALILSASPSLTASAARSILESTCSKVGGYTYTSSVSGQPNGSWSTELGYGRVNAYAALQAISPCSGVPATATISSTLACPNASFTVSATGGSAGSGITYQWQSSANGSTSWTVITGGTDPTLTVTGGITSPIYYRLKTTCTNGNQSSFSNVLNVAPASLSQCYCIPSVTTTDELITNVTVAGINNSSTGFGTAGYQDFTGLSAATMQAGTAYPFSATIAPFYSGDVIAVWIDLNRDGTFANPGERMLMVTGVNPATGTITIPSGTTSGATRMRVRLDYNNTNPDPCGTTQYGNIEDYTVNISSCATPSVSIAATTPQTVCAGSSVSFAATPVNGGATPAYQWKVNGSNITGATNSTFTSAFGATSTVSVVMTAAAPCAAMPAATSNTLSVTTTPVVAPQVSIAASANPVTAGTSVTFTATPVNGGTTPVYQWKKNGTVVGGNSPTYSTSVLSNGDQITCQLTSNASCLSATTANSNTVTIGITPPSCTATITAGGPLIFCPGGSVTLTASPGTSYQWSNGATTQSITVSQSNNYSVTVNNNGCLATSNFVTVLVKAIPTISLVYASSLSFCDGGSVELSISPTVNIAGFTNFQWTNNGVSIPGAITTSYTATTAGAYTLTVADGIGCSKTSTAKTVVVKPLPVANFSAAGVTTFCAPGFVNLQADVYPSQTYKWFLNGTSSGSGAIKKATLSGVYTMEAKLGTCVVTAPSSITVTVNPLPVATITTASPTTFCPGDSALLQANPSNPLYTYQWMLGTASLVGSSDQYMAKAKGSYKVNVIDNNGCQKLSAAKTISHLSAPTATITPLSSTTIAANGNVKLRAYGTAPTYTWQWYKNGTILAGETNKDYVATTGGNYTVVATKGTCSLMSAPTTVIQTTLREIVGVTAGGAEESFELIAYPNPLTDQVTIGVKGTAGEKATIQVLSVSGSLIMQQETTGFETRIDMSAQASGVYFVRYQDTLGHTGMVRIVKQ